MSPSCASEQNSRTGRKYMARFLSVCCLQSIGEHLTRIKARHLSLSLSLSIMEYKSTLTTNYKSNQIYSNHLNPARSLNHLICSKASSAMAHVSPPSKLTSANRNLSLPLSSGSTPRAAGSGSTNPTVPAEPPVST